MEQYISLILNLVLGGGFITTVVMLRAQKRQGMAAAQKSEIDNLERVAGIWRKSLEEREKFFEEEMASLRRKIGEMEATIRGLTSTNKQILKILKDINHDNLEQKKEEAKTLANTQN
ncbi:MAG: hypothetical protein BGO29_07485 [Bacteroidales bacterium 36-12]|jgi:hypothetical protein|nr:MAG: hypothetical protein BGO29_07485 [Bacteroidales bacterium 36-12]